MTPIHSNPPFSKLKSPIIIMDDFQCSERGMMFEQQLLKKRDYIIKKTRQKTKRITPVRAGLYF